ncbi:uncharacterized protein LOC117649417 [Thrips palmi]|uniref:Protein DP71L n=1 Tax=Thrips palmi TaxID=161013 RepID=A0A6P8ZSP0_THRPL|nr:uncharacterized protein LOC117649417 [Thrips palmi]
MALPMGLCPDSKRSLNFCLLKKNQNTTMLDKSGGCAVFSTSSPCSPADIGLSKTSKFPACLPQPSFHTRTLLTNSFIVGGFLGSKSQGRSTNSPLSVLDIIPDLFSVAECLHNFQHCNFSSVSSPPKKKFAKGESLSNLALINTYEFPVIEDKTCEESRVDSSKQSYAEVAKAATGKPSVSESSKGSKGLADACSKQNTPRSGSRKDCARRRSDTADHRSSRRKSNKRERSESSSSRKLFPGSIPSPSTESQLEPFKDLRLCQQEKHFSQLQSAASNRNSRKSERHFSSSTNPNKRDRLHSDQIEGKHRPKRRSNYRTHCDNKRGNRAKNFDCDIDKINWRTGEPISGKMGPQNDYVNGEDYLADQSCNNSCTSEQSNEVCTGEPRKPDLMSEISWHELPSASPRCRRRSLSECSVGSEDSFIVFQSGGAPSDSLSDQGSDWSDCDSDDSFESDSEMSDEDDMCDGLYTSASRLKEVNDHWQREYEAIKDPAQSISGKKVCFSTSKPTIHRMLAWDFAYRMSRPGPWEAMGRDRERFRARIRQYEAILSPVLTSEHRNKIWNRFHS